MIRKTNCPSKYCESVHIAKYLFTVIKKKNIGEKARKASILGSRTQEIVREVAYRLLVRNVFRC